jgi:hypothetical protein
MLSPVLHKKPGMTLPEMLAALSKEFGWKCAESNLTVHLCTNPKRFSHTKADRLGKNPVRWSLPPGT